MKARCAENRRRTADIFPASRYYTRWLRLCIDKAKKAKAFEICAGALRPMPYDPGRTQRLLVITVLVKASLMGIRRAAQNGSSSSESKSSINGAEGAYIHEPPGARE